MPHFTEYLPKRSGLASGTTVWRTRPFLDVLFVAGQLQVVAGPERTLLRVDGLSLFAQALLRALAAASSGASTADLIAANRALGSEAASDLLLQAVDAGLLVPESASNMGSELVTAGVDTRVQRQQQLRRARQYANYGARTVYRDDAERMRVLAASDPPPSVESRPLGPVMRLPHPSIAEPRSLLALLGHLLFYGFGLLRPATFLGTLEVQLRPVPSFGARHPFDAAILISSCCSEMPAGRYLYVPSLHGLVRTGEGQKIERWPILQIRAVYERVQWRYRYALAYEMVLLDLGHIKQQLRLCATSLGLTLAEVASEKDSLQLTNGVLSTFEIGGPDVR
ncbi:MAG: hypothetical protein ACRENL_11740 [Candidatus Dormibacteria bacterium]